MSNAPQDFDFTLEKSPQSLLVEMKEDDFFQNRKPRRFENGRNTVWNQELLEDLLELLSYFHQKRIIWETLRINISKTNERFTRPLIHAANTMKIFENVRLWFSFDRDTEEYDEFCPGISFNDFTKHLHIMCVGKMSRGHCIALSNLLQANPPCLKGLKCDFTYWVGEDIDYTLILPGLRENRTLKNLSLSFSRKSHVTSDAFTSEIIASVASNPNFESLGIKNEDWSYRSLFGELSSQALKRLLSDSTSLKSVWLYSKYENPGLDSECLIQGLKNSRSMKRLDIRGLLSGDLIFTKFFRILPDCPLMEYIRLDGKDVVTEADLPQMKLLPRLSRPLLVQGPVYSQISDIQLELLTELLRYHPEVRLSLRDYADNIKDELRKYYEGKADFWHVFNMNWHGRYFLDRPNVPLSIWPLVLEKVNGNRLISDKASIIHALLKGPAWGGRIL